MPQTVPAPSPKAGRTMRLHLYGGSLEMEKKAQAVKHPLQPHANYNLAKKKPWPSNKKSNVKETNSPAKASVATKKKSSAMGTKSATKSPAKATNSKNQVPPAFNSKSPLPPASQPMPFSSMPGYAWCQHGCGCLRGYREGLKEGSNKFEDMKPKHFHFGTKQEFDAPHIIAAHIIAGIIDKANITKVPKLASNHPREQENAFNHPFHIVAALASLDNDEELHLPTSQPFVVNFDGNFKGMKD